MKNEGMLLLPAIAFSQSCYEGYEASKAIDHNENTSWKAGPYYQWLLIDLQNVCYVSSVHIQFFSPQGYYHYHIEYSFDRMNWRLLSEKKDDVPEPMEGTAYTVKQKCRYIRITVSYCSVSRDVEIRDVCVYGQECAQTPAVVDIREHRIEAVHADDIVGFEEYTAEEIEPGWNPRALTTDKASAYIGFRDVNFDGRFDQLRIYLGTPLKSKTHFLDIRIALDSPDGLTVGKLHICRQWREWSEIAVELLLPDGSSISGAHNLYIILDAIDQPQNMELLYLELAKHPVLSTQPLDYKEDLLIGTGDQEKEAEYQVFFGNMHCHTAFSDGSATPEVAYAYARDAKLDFLGITEHSNCLDEAFDCDKSRKFRDLKAQAEAMTEPGRFVALYGSETTWYNQFGHMNIYCADFYLNSYEFKYDDSLAYYRKLKQYPYIISQWNHPWSCGNRHLDLFQPYDEELDRITYTMELNDIEMPEEKVLTWYIIALDAGWHIAPVGNQDNHREDWGTENGIRTGVIAKRLTAGHIYDAMKNLRVYFTGAPGIRVIYRLNGMMQGSVTDSRNGLHLSVSASVNEQHRFTRIDVYGEHGRIVYQDTLDSDSLNYEAELPCGERYYFVKLVREDNRYAITAPVWITNT